MPKQPVRVHIFNQAYTLLADGDPSAIHQAAQEVDALMNSIAGRTSSSDGSRIAVMACLHLADKLHAAERKLQAFEEHSDRLAGLLNTTLSF